MSFPIPVFPLLCDQWLSPRNPGSGAPDVTNLACQLYHNPHAIFPFIMYVGTPTNPQQDTHSIMSLIKFPVGTVTLNAFDILQPDNTVAEYHQVRYVCRFYAGFPQAFDGAYCTRVDATGSRIFFY